MRCGRCHSSWLANDGGIGGLHLRVTVFLQTFVLGDQVLIVLLQECQFSFLGFELPKQLLHHLVFIWGRLGLCRHWVDFCECNLEV